MRLINKFQLMFILLLFSLPLGLALDVDVGCPNTIDFVAGNLFECIVKNPDTTNGINLMSLTIDEVTGGRAEFVSLESLVGTSGMDNLFPDDPLKSGFVKEAYKEENLFKITLRMTELSSDYHRGSSSIRVNLNNVVVKDTFDHVYQQSLNNIIFLNDVTIFNIPDCVPDCAGRVCGDDTCGDSCGICEEGYFCLSGKCAPIGCLSDPGCDYVGKIRCSAEDYLVQTCGNYDDDLCLEWSEPTACPRGEYCNTRCMADPRCSNGVKSEQETDVDCGGTCLPCAIDKTCSVDTDCLTNNCQESVCACSSSEEICGDGLDNNCDGLVDCADDGCVGDPACDTDGDVLGDVNGDGDISLDDAILIARVALDIPGFTLDNPTLGDTNCVEGITLDDAILIARVALDIPGFETVACS